MKSIQWSLNDSDVNFPTVTSSTLEYLSLDGGAVRLSQMVLFFKYTPRLQNLSVRIQDSYYNQVLFQPVPSMTTLEIHWLDNPTDELIKLLIGCPNLYQLKIKTHWAHVDGHQWEQVIVNHLPKLKKFHLNMTFLLRTQIENLLNSFRTAFWLLEHQWFVQSDWNLANPSNMVNLYTWPYAFRNFSYYNSIGSKSTSLDDSSTCSYSHVHSLSYNSSFSQYAPLSPVRFSNLRHLKLFLPWDDYFRSVVPKLDRLTSLHLSRYDDHAHSQIQTLLNRAPHIYSLIIDSCPDANVVPIKITSQSIRRLEFKDYFDNARCIALSR
jgi:hypothetical protein